jgi:hypothetical protein
MKARSRATVDCCKFAIVFAAFVRPKRLVELFHSRRRFSAVFLAWLVLPFQAPAGFGLAASQRVALDYRGASTIALAEKPCIVLCVNVVKRDNNEPAVSVSNFVFHYASSLEWFVGMLAFQFFSPVFRGVFLRRAAE